MVWTVEKQTTHEQHVIKILKKEHETAPKRFLDEIKIITENQDNAGVIKIRDQANSEDEDLWYIMPKVTLFLQSIMRFNFLSRNFFTIFKLYTDG